MGVCLWTGNDKKELSHQVLDQKDSEPQKIEKPKMINNIARIKKQRELREREHRISSSIMEWLRKKYIRDTSSLEVSIHSQVFVFWSPEEEPILQKLVQVKPSFITNILIKIDENPNLRDLMKQSFPDLNSSVVFSKTDNDKFMTRNMLALISKVSSRVNRKVVFKNIKLKTKDFWNLLQMFSHVQEVTFEDWKVNYNCRKFKINPKYRFKIRMIGMVRSGLKHKTLRKIYQRLKEQSSLSLCLTRVVVAGSDKDTPPSSTKKEKPKTQRSPQNKSQSTKVANMPPPTFTNAVFRPPTLSMQREIYWKMARFYSSKSLL